MNNKMLMFNKVTSSRYHNKMIQSVEPLKNHFNLLILKKTSEWLEGFGFCFSDNHLETYEKLLNEIPLLTRFIEYFKEVNAPIFKIVEEYQLRVNNILGLDSPKLKINNSD